MTNQLNPAVSPFVPQAVAFAGTRRLSEGTLDRVALDVQAHVAREPLVPVLVFDAVTSQVIDLDLRGDAEAVRAHVAALVRERDSRGAGEPAEVESPRGPGRPRLGVVAREVTLLPRHWEWLGTQPGGASAVLRRLVDQARKAGEGRDRVRRAQESAYRFMSAMAGNEPGFEEATRALFAGKPEVFDALVARWPGDVRDHARKVAAAAFVVEGDHGADGSERVR